MDLGKYRRDRFGRIPAISDAAGALRVQRYREIPRTRADFARFSAMSVNRATGWWPPRSLQFSGSTSPIIRRPRSNSFPTRGSSTGSVPSSFCAALIPDLFDLPSKVVREFELTALRQRVLLCLDVAIYAAKSAPVRQISLASWQRRMLRIHSLANSDAILSVAKRAGATIANCLLPATQSEEQGAGSVSARDQLGDFGERRIALSLVQHIMIEHCAAIAGAASVSANGIALLLPQRSCDRPSSIFRYCEGPSTGSVPSSFALR
jgi:hypothetical protein